MTESVDIAVNENKEVLLCDVVIAFDVTDSGEYVVMSGTRKVDVLSETGVKIDPWLDDTDIDRTDWFSLDAVTSETEKVNIFVKLSIESIDENKIESDEENDKIDKELDNVALSTFWKEDNSENLSVVLDISDLTSDKNVP